ncbi:helix-turn-helix transcriptional regulator [Enterobacter kobei]|uniref:helix-turn-helix transcriptional regulator n=1 Tax=Enterobacter kobei TaxID=208224 RepID=UPI0020753BE2|nr:hypothetical protein [Enterobacter kobei]MCM7506581.1 hypothetical protein [Enterobacter kobei]
MSDCTYINIVSDHLLRFLVDDFQNHSDKSICIFFLVGELNEISQIHDLLYNEENYFLLFTTEKNLRFMASLKLSKNISFFNLNLQLTQVYKKIKQCLNIIIDNEENFYKKKSKLNLTKMERDVVLLYVSGVPIYNIAKKKSHSTKTTYSQISSSISKLGLRTRVELFKKSKIIKQCSDEGFF